jgi:hypothetical protein
VELYTAVKRLIGDIDPIGEPNEDYIRYDNLLSMNDLVEKLIMDIDRIAYTYANCHQFTAKRASITAREFMDNLCLEE